MKKITIEEAEQILFNLLDDDIEDVVYEAARALLFKLVKKVEDNYTIVNKDILDRGEEWYDSVEDLFMQEVYDRMSKFLNKNM